MPVFDPNIRGPVKLRKDMPTLDQLVTSHPSSENPRHFDYYAARMPRAQDR